MNFRLFGRNTLGVQDKIHLVKLLLECPSIQDAATFDTLLTELPHDIQKAIKKHDSPRVHVLNIVDACLNYENGFDSLIEVLRFFDGTTKQFQELTKFIKTHTIPTIPEIEQITENLPSKIYDIFLSYAKADSDWCQKLANRLNQAGVQVWFDEWAVKAGDDRETKIKEGLKCARRIAAIWTPHYFHPDNFDNYSIVDETLNQPPTVLAQDRPLIPLLRHAFDIPNKFKKLKPINFSNADDFELMVRQLLEALDLPRQEFIAKAEDRLREYEMESRDKPKTKAFVEAAAVLYRLLGYSVKTPKVENAQFDLQIEQKRGGARIQAVQEVLTQYV